MRGSSEVSKVGDAARAVQQPELIDGSGDGQGSSAGAEKTKTTDGVLLMQCVARRGRRDGLED